MSFENLPERLRITVGPASYRQIADRVEMNAESVRRYMHGQAVPAEFIAAVCRAYGVSGSWLLLGIGPRTLDADRSATIRSATTEELLAAISERVVSEPASEAPYPAF